MLERLAFVMLAVRDVDRAATFYRDALGLPMTARFEDFAFFDTGDATLALTAELGRDGGGDSQGHECVFAVSSVEKAYTALRNRVQFVNEPRRVNDLNWAVKFPRSRRAPPIALWPAVASCAALPTDCTRRPSTFCGTPERQIGRVPSGPHNCPPCRC